SGDGESSLNRLGIVDGATATTNTGRPLQSLPRSLSDPVHPVAAECEPRGCTVHNRSWAVVTGRQQVPRGDTPLAVRQGQTQRLNPCIFVGDVTATYASPYRTTDHRKVPCGTSAVRIQYQSMELNPSV
ncbi:hypothetical protein AAFF_G00215570, partial [Aldrovandia affinis]